MSLVCLLYTSTAGVIDDFASQIGQDIIDRAYELKEEFAAQAQ